MRQYTPYSRGTSVPYHVTHTLLPAAAAPFARNVIAAHIPTPNSHTVWFLGELGYKARGKNHTLHGWIFLQEISNCLILSSPSADRPKVSALVIAHLLPHCSHGPSRLISSRSGEVPLDIQTSALPILHNVAYSFSSLASIDCFVSRHFAVSFKSKH